MRGRHAGPPRRLADRRNAAGRGPPQDQKLELVRLVDALAGALAGGGDVPVRQRALQLAQAALKNRQQWPALVDKDLANPRDLKSALTLFSSRRNAGAEAATWKVMKEKLRALVITSEQVRCGGRAGGPGAALCRAPGLACVRAAAGITGRPWGVQPISLEGGRLWGSHAAPLSRRGRAWGPHACAWPCTLAQHEVVAQLAALASTVEEYTDQLSDQLARLSEFTGGNFAGIVSMLIETVEELQRTTLVTKEYVEAVSPALLGAAATLQATGAHSGLKALQARMLATGVSVLHEKLAEYRDRFAAGSFASIAPMIEVMVDAEQGLDKLKRAAAEAKDAADLATHDESRLRLRRRSQPQQQRQQQQQQQQQQMEVSAQELHAKATRLATEVKEFHYKYNAQLNDLWREGQASATQDIAGLDALGSNIDERAAGLEALISTVDERGIEASLLDDAQGDLSEPPAQLTTWSTTALVPHLPACGFVGAVFSAVLSALLTFGAMHALS